MTGDLFDESGEPRFGVYTGEIRDLDLSAYRKKPPFGLAALRKKRWRFVGMFSPEVTVGVAVVDSGYAGLTFAYAFDMSTRVLTEFRAQSPLASACEVDDSLDKGEFRFVRGADRVVLGYDAERGEVTISVDVTVKGGRLVIEGRADESRRAVVPHQVISPTPQGRVAFTHKTAGMPAFGKIETPIATYELDEKQSFAAVDHTCGYHDHSWQWRWASLSGLAEDRQRVGLNLVDPIHHPTINENAMWVEGRRYPLPSAQFEFDRKSILSSWHIRTQDNAVDLRFDPLGERCETLNAGLIVSRFHQPIGRFSGRLTPPGAPPIILSGVSGVCEDHLARW